MPKAYAIDSGIGAYLLRNRFGAAFAAGTALPLSSTAYQAEDRNSQSPRREAPDPTETGHQRSPITRERES